jgi:hypothetical protein
MRIDKLAAIAHVDCGIITFGKLYNTPYVDGVCVGGDLVNETSTYCLIWSDVYYDVHHDGMCYIAIVSKDQAWSNPREIWT